MTTRVPNDMPMRDMHDEASQQTMDQGQHGEMPMRPMNAHQAGSEVSASREESSMVIASTPESEVEAKDVDAELVAYLEAQERRAKGLSEHGDMPIKEMN